MVLVAMESRRALRTAPCGYRGLTTGPRRLNIRRDGYAVESTRSDRGGPRLHGDAELFAVTWGQQDPALHAIYGADSPAASGNAGRDRVRAAREVDQQAILDPFGMG